MANQTDRADAELLAAVARGDGSAFTVMYCRYLPLVLRWCWRATRNREVAADLSAEVFAAALVAAHPRPLPAGGVARPVMTCTSTDLRPSSHGHAWRRGGRSGVRVPRRQSGLWVRKVWLDPIPIGADEVASCVPHEDRRAMHVAGGRLDIAVLDTCPRVVRLDQTAAEPLGDDL